MALYRQVNRYNKRSMVAHYVRTHRSSRWLLHRSLLSAVAVVLMLSSVSVAYAHPQIVSAEPAPDAQLDAAPSSVRIAFNEPIEEAFASVTVLDATGRAVDRGDSGRSPDDPRVLQVSLPSLDPGVYTVAWQAVGRDGHLVRGYFTFTILGAPPAPAAPDPTLQPTSALAMEDAPETPPVSLEPGPTPPLDLLALLRSVMLISAVTAIGGLVFLLVGLPLNGKGLTAPMRQMIAGASFLLLMATLAFLGLYTISVAGRLTLETLMVVARDTRLGQALVGRMALTLAFIATVRLSSRWSAGGGVVIGGLILLTFSSSGHAAATAQPFVSIALDWMHLAAATLWVGGLMALTVVLIRWKATPTPSLVRPALMRFSKLALVSVVILTISGAFAALSYLRDVSDLWVTDYGRALLAKTTLFALVAGFGAYHLGLVRRAAKHAATAATAIVQRMRHSVTLETALAMGVVGIAGVLTSLPHPGATPVQTPIVAVPAVAPEPASIIAEETAAPEEPAPPPTPQPFAATRPAGDLRVALHVEPAVVGRNLMRITVTDEQNQLRDVQRVRVMLRLNDRDIGETSVIAEPEGEGRYVVRDQMLGIAGVWRVQVQVRRIDADDVMADFLVLIRR